MGNAREFTLEIKKWGLNLEQEQVVALEKKLTMELLKRVDKKSPVDTGRFKANWMTGIGKIDEATTEDTTADSVERGRAVIANLKRPEKIYVSNNLPYAWALEYGHSMKAPLGVLEISVIEIDMAMEGGGESGI